MSAAARPQDARYRRIAGTPSWKEGSNGWTIEPPQRRTSLDASGYRSTPARWPDTAQGSLDSLAQPHAT